MGGAESPPLFLFLFSRKDYITMKYLVADYEKLNNPLYEQYEDGSRPCFSDWRIFLDYGSANNYVRDRLAKIDNPSVSFAIVPLDTDNAERVELIYPNED